MDIFVSLVLSFAFAVEAAMSAPLGGRWINNKLDNIYNNSTRYNDDDAVVVDNRGGKYEIGEENVTSDFGGGSPSSCFPTLQECASRCPVSCREVSDCGGISGTHYACSWDLIIIVVAVGVLACVLFLLCFLTWRQRRGRRTQLQYGRVNSNDNLLRRCSRQRAPSLIANPISSAADSAAANDSRRSSGQPFVYPHYL